MFGKSVLFFGVVGVKGTIEPLEGLSKLLMMFGLLPGSIYPYGLQYEAFM